ncbi:MAG: LysE family transporter [Chloroflexi bacterium]|nr:LysE family transporter [Chloroflexota bacterium]
MDNPLFWQGLLFGVGIAAPVGPIGVLTIRRTLTEGLLIGLLTGLGAATADALYGSVAALGLTAVSNFLIQYQTWLRLGGGLFLLYLGLKTLRLPAATNAPQSAASNPKSQIALLHAYTTTLFLTLSNPVTILSFTAVFAGFGLGSQTHGAGAGVQLVLGVFLGSALWWLTLCLAVTAVRARLSPTVFRLINLASGLILIGFSLALLFTGL